MIDLVRTAIGNRYDEQILVELTNPRAPQATQIDEVRLEQGIRSAATFFEFFAQSIADPEANPQHLEVLVNGAIACLQKWGGASDGVARIDWSDWEELARAQGRVEARGHEGPYQSPEVVVEPSTNSEKFGTSRVFPEFDDRFFFDMIPTRRQSGPRYSPGRLY